MNEIPTTDAERELIKKSLIAQLEGTPNNVLPQKYWAEYAEIVSNVISIHKEVTSDDIISLLQSKSGVIDPTLLFVMYNALISSAVIAGLKIKYKNEWR